MTRVDDSHLVWPSVDLTAAAHLLRARQASAREILEAHLQRIEWLDDVLRACITVMADDARKTAMAVDAHHEVHSADASPLAGLPIGLKDNFNTSGVLTTAATRALAHNIPSVDAAAVDLLKRARVLLIAKFNMDELALGGPFGSELRGIMVNPWDAASIPGGSSGGSAIAVAASMCMAATGSDTGGSIRNPAAWCGVTGFKPTQGAISTDGIIPVSWSLDTAGWLAHTAADCALLFAETSQALTRETPAYKRSFVDRATSPPKRPLRFGIARAAVDMCEAAVREPLNAALRALQGAGTFDEVLLPSLDDALVTMMTITFSEASSAWNGVLRQSWQLLGKEVRTMLDVGRTFAAIDYLDAQRARAGMRRAVDVLFEAQDVVLMPSLGTAPRPDAFVDCPPGPQHPDAHLGGKMTVLWSLAGNPVISLPCGFTDAGRPVAMQLIGARGRDGLLLQAAKLVEEAWAIPWAKLEPAWTAARAAARISQQGRQEEKDR